MFHLLLASDPGGGLFAGIIIGVVGGVGAVGYGIYHFFGGKTK